MSDTISLKQRLWHRVIAQLQSEIDTASQALNSAHEAATHEENIPENKYDTLSLEAAYLAHGQAQRLEQLQQSLHKLKLQPLKPFSDDDEIGLGALVSLEHHATGAICHLLLSSEAGGLSVTLQQQEYRLLTPQSPLGQALIGRCLDDDIEVATSQPPSCYTIIDLS